MVACSQCERTTHRELPFHLFLAQYPSARRSSRPVFHWYRLSRNRSSRSLEAARMADHPGASIAPGAERWFAFRAVHLLSRLRTGFISARGGARVYYDVPIPPEFDRRLEKMLD